MKDLTPLERSLNYKFNDQTLLISALTHRSFSRNNNERLEYLGDAVLGFVISDIVFQKFPQATEGELTLLRISLVKGKTLSKLSQELNLSDYIRLGQGELKNGGWQCDSILANVLEAVIGALYLDAGIEVCRQFIAFIYHKLLLDLSLDKLSKDPKTELQELLQSQKQQLPSYQLLSENDAHEKIFTVSCTLNEKNVSVKAQGKNKRMAEQSAAKKMLSLLGQSTPKDKINFAEE